MAKPESVQMQALQRELQLAIRRIVAEIWLDEKFLAQCAKEIDSRGLTFPGEAERELLLEGIEAVCVRPEDQTPDSDKPLPIC